MIERILNSRAKTITFAAFLLGLSTFISGLLGILKLRLLASQFELHDLDSYFVAFRFPDLISATLITGGIIVSFLPLFSQYFQKRKEDAWELTNNIISVAITIFSFLCAIVWLFAPFFVDIIVPGFTGPQKELAVSLTRIMFISPLIFSISAVFSGVLQYFDRFLIYALAPIFYNSGIIFGIVVLSRFFETPIYGVAYGVVLGAFLHLLIQIPPAIKCGYKFKFIFNLKDPGIRRMGRLMIPRMVGQASSQISLIAITFIASFLAVGSVAIFNFANNLYLFPVAIIGVSFAVAAFPSFSKHLANGEKRSFFNNFSAAFRRIIFIMLPVSLMTLILRAQIVRLALGGGDFDWAETRLTAAALGVFSLAILFSSFIPLIVRVFFSLQDTRTPAIASVASVVLNIISAFVFTFLFREGGFLHPFIYTIFKLEGIPDIQVVGLAFAVSLATTFQFFVLLYFLKKRMPDLPFMGIWNSFKKTLFASLVMIVASYFTLKLAVVFVELTTFWAVLFQATFSFSMGVIVYLTVLHSLKSRELKGIILSVKKQFKIKNDKRKY